MINPRTMQLARVQDGLVTRRQALATGTTDAAVKHALGRGGRWQRLLPGVYACFVGPPSDLHRLRAAVLHAGPVARVTGAWACRLLGLDYGPEPEKIDVLVPTSCRRSSLGFVRLVRTARLPRPLYWRDEAAPARRAWEVDDLVPTTRAGEIPVATAARVIVDTVTGLRRLPADWRHADRPDRAVRNVRALMCEGVQRRRCTVADLATEVRAAPRPGTKLAAQVLDDLRAGCRSAPECELRDLITTSRILPQPRWNEPLPGAGDVIPDACWKKARLVAEVDSRSWHGFGDAPERTERRRARYAALGWRVIPVSPRRLREEPLVVLREIEAAYLAAVS